MEHAAYKLGVDGGGTGCRARLTDLQGRVLGEGRAGPANLLLGPELALRAVLEATRQALDAAGLDESALRLTHAGLGLAGANVPSHHDGFRRQPMPFLSVSLRSDAEAACLGAHAGGDGGILILGTGSQAVLHRQGRFSTIGGWGFTVSDTGSGALLGRAAVRHALLAHEGVESASALTRHVMERFGRDPAAVVEWAAAAKPRDWAALAPEVFEHAALGDDVAVRLVRASARAAESLLRRLADLGAGPVCLMGGLAAPTRRYLGPAVLTMLREPQADAMAGALMLAGR